MARDFTSETGRLAGAKGNKTKRLIGDAQKITRKLLSTRFDVRKREDVKEALESVNYYEGRDEDEKKTLCLSAMIACHMANGFFDVNSAKFVLELAGMTPASKKISTEVKKMELEVKKLQAELDAQQATEDKPESGPEVSESEICESLTRMGVIG